MDKAVKKQISEGLNAARAALGLIGIGGHSVRLADSLFEKLRESPTEENAQRLYDIVDAIAQLARTYDALTPPVADYGRQAFDALSGALDALQALRQAAA